MKFATVIAATLALGAPAHAADFEVDRYNSSVMFTVRHFVSNVTGFFKDYEGTFTFDKTKPEASTVSFTVKAASIDTGVEKRDNHLRSGDFFEVDKHPTLTFVGKKLTKAGKGKFKLAGDLTMRGVTKPVTFDVEYHGETPDFEKNVRTGFTATAKVNRKDFGIVWNKTLDSGSLLLSDDVTIKLQVEAVEKKPAVVQQ
jgi:polyisoprenoid-binding protein YceI